MKCQNCTTDFVGSFCPICGAKASVNDDVPVNQPPHLPGNSSAPDYNNCQPPGTQSNPPYHNNSFYQSQDTQNTPLPTDYSSYQSADAQEKPPKSNSVWTVLGTIFDVTNRLFVGSILCTIIAFAMKQVIAGIILLLCAVITSPKVRVKFPNKFVLRIVVIFLAGLAAAISVTSDTTSQSEVSQISPDEFKESCIYINYENLVRYPNKYKGDNLVFTGEIYQVDESSFEDVEGGENLVFLIIDVTDYGSDRYSYSENLVAAVISIPKNKERLLEGDTIRFWGTGTGTYSYETILGSNATLPSVDIKYYELER